jgi:DNA-binding SARP family transcriptional activator
MISLRTLGPLEVRSDGDPAPAGLLQRKNVALLIYLARSPHCVRSREHLTGVLWAEKPESKARHSLREAVRVLRRALGEDGIIAEADQLRLTGGKVALDIEQFEQCESAGDWQGAADLIGGEFLEGFSVREAWAFDEWLAAERSHWRSRTAKALVRYSDDLLACGKTDAAVKAANRANTIDSGSGPAVRAAMKSLAVAGDRTEALVRYAEFRSRLAEVSAAPDVETVQMAERVQREREWQLAASVPLNPEQGAELRRAPLIGREKELAGLVALWSNTVVEPNAAVAVIEGDVGYGKTRLSEELIARARLDGATVSSLRAVAADRDQPASGIAGLARGGLLAGRGLAAASPSALAAFAAEIDEWADRFGVPKGPVQPLETALVEIVRALAGEQPVLLLVDDAQWCDRQSILALGSIIRDLPDCPILVTLAVSTTPARDELDDVRSRIGRDIPGTTVKLDKLDETSLRELARWAVPGYTDEQIDRLTRRVASDSAGLPLLAVELLHAVALGLDLEETAAAWPQPLRTLSQTLPGELPDAIVAAIRVGFRRLSSPAQEALAAAAVLGHCVTATQLGQCTGLKGKELNSALDELEWQRWLAADARGYSFIARIVQEVVAQDMVTEGQKLRIKQAAE